MEDWDEPWPKIRSHRIRKRKPVKRSGHSDKKYTRPICALQDDRAETFDPYSCDRCPDERPVRQPLEMYVVGDGTERRLTASEVYSVFATKYLEELHEAMLWNKPLPVDPYHVYNYGGRDD